MAVVDPAQAGDGPAEVGPLLRIVDEVDGEVPLLRRRLSAQQQEKGRGADPVARDQRGSSPLATGWPASTQALQPPRSAFTPLTPCSSRSCAARALEFSDGQAQ
jgi:hypothetical protein